eukprot:scaffold287_cov173-Amphora_coffeaeformis.AAC.15
MTASSSSSSSSLQRTSRTTTTTTTTCTGMHHSCEKGCHSVTMMNDPRQHTALPGGSCRRKRKCGVQLLTGDNDSFPGGGRSISSKDHRERFARQPQNWNARDSVENDSMQCLDQNHNREQGDPGICSSRWSGSGGNARHDKGQILKFSFSRLCCGWLVLLLYCWGLPGVVFAAGGHSKNDNDSPIRLRPQSLRGLQIAAPPEEDVTANPTTNPTFRPSPPPTRRPTASPTRFPTFAPTGRPTTTAPTQSPTRSPSINPTRRPTLVPSPQPTAVPTRTPSASPSGLPTFLPTRSPTFTPTFMPLAVGETRAPSPVPTTAAPSLTPSTLPTSTLKPTDERPTPVLTEETTQSPVDTQWEAFTIERSVQVFLELPATQRASPVGLANIWQDYIESTLRLVYGRRDESVRLLDVLVLVDGETASTIGGGTRALQQDEGQQQEATIVQNFQLDTTVDLEKRTGQRDENVENQVAELLGNLLSAENLQGALEDARVNGVSVAKVTEPLPPKQRSIKEKPGRIEIIIGFALVGIMLAMLLITVHSRIKSMRKRRKKRRLAKLRQKNSYVMPKQERPVPTSQEKSKAAAVYDDDKQDVESDIVGMSVLDDESLPSNVPTAGTSDDNSDLFAHELKQAAVMDDEAWKQLQRKKEELRKRGRVVDSMYSTAAGSGEEGVEIGTAGLATGNFPYGVDNRQVGQRSSSGTTPPSTPPAPQPIVSPAMQRLSPEDVVRWSTAGLTLNIVGRDEPSSGFEPYGETKKDPSFQESWDMDESPKEYFGQYSFMNPLRPRSNDTTQARVPSPTSLSEDPSTVAVRASMSVSSWSEVDGGDLRASPTESMVPLGMIRETSVGSRSDEADTTNNESYGTVDMLQEVQRLSAYVKRYEKKKEMQRGFGASTAGGESSVSYDALSDSLSAQRMGGRNGVSPPRLTKTSYRQAAAMNHTTSMESSGFGPLESSSELSGVSETDDEGSTRLGISRFSIQTPSTNGLMYSVEELPIPAAASPEEGEDDALMMSMSPGRGLSMESSYSLGLPMAPDKPMDRPHSPASDTPDDERVGNLGGPRQVTVGKLDQKVGKGRLSKLRQGTGNMLDGEEKSQHTAPSDEFTREERQAPKPVASPPPVRSKNRGFTNIISMFESKPKNPIAPPDENWQHGVKSTPKK